MHRGVQWPQPTLQWPDGRRVCCTFRVAYEAFRKSGRFKKNSKIAVNVTSLSHANYGGAVGIWRLMDIFDRHQIKAHDRRQRARGREMAGDHQGAARRPATRSPATA